jgi:dolichyl-phosphooligosaccharide-protein glycotransferase
MAYFGGALLARISRKGRYGPPAAIAALLLLQWPTVPLLLQAPQTLSAVPRDVWQACLWLRDHGAESLPERGAVLASWEYGHWIEFLARRPALMDNFGSHVGQFHEACVLLAEEDPRRVEAGLRSRGAEFVLLTGLGDFDQAVSLLGGKPADFWTSPDPAVHDSAWPTDRLLASLVGRLWLLDGTELPSVATMAQPRRSGRAALPFLRLAYEGLWRIPFAPLRQFISRVKIFQVVAGALLEGRAEPGLEIECSALVATNRSREFRFRATSRADSGGDFRLRVPYAERAGSLDCGVVGGYLVRGGGGSGRVVVEEPMVLSGAAVPVRLE